MYPTQDRVKQQERRVTITEVNTSARQIIARDAQGRSYQIGLDLTSPVVTIPLINELWTVTQRGVEWHLGRRLEDDLQLTPIESLLPGDRRLEADNILYLNGGELVFKFNGGMLFTENGQLKYRAPDGTITVIAG